ncbi:hypothetical protein [Amylibacter marinus]|nr:hypothetical protein [Amylibacter marinus]
MTLKDYQDRYGPELGEVIFHVERAVVELQITWRDYCILFENNPKRNELLRKAGGNTVLRIQRLFQDDIVMQLSRLLETSNSKQNRAMNLALLQTQLLEEHNEFAQKVPWTKKKAWKKLKFHRDKRIGHAEVNAFNDGLASNCFNRDYVSGVIDKIRKIFEHISANRDDLNSSEKSADRSWRIIGPAPSANWLLHTIYLGVECFDESGLDTTVPDWLRESEQDIYGYTRN